MVTALFSRGQLANRHANGFKGTHVNATSCENISILLMTRDHWNPRYAMASSIWIALIHILYIHIAVQLGLRTPDYWLRLSAKKFNRINLMFVSYTVPRCCFTLFYSPNPTLPYLTLATPTLKGYILFFSSCCICDGSKTPYSVTIPPVISRAGVTSNAGFQHWMPKAAIEWPIRWVSSFGGLSSIFMLSPVMQSRSTDVEGAAT